MRADQVRGARLSSSAIRSAASCLISARSHAQQQRRATAEHLGPQPVRRERVRAAANVASAHAPATGEHVAEVGPGPLPERVVATDAG